MKKPNKSDILSFVGRLDFQEPPPGPFCVSHIFGDPRLVEFARAKAALSGGRWNQLTIWIQSEGESFPPPPSHPEWLRVIDISELWPDPNPMGRPQGLMYLLAGRMWDSWERPFCLNDIDVYFDLCHLSRIHALADPSQPLTFARQKHHPHVFGGIGYVHGDVSFVSDKVAGKMAGQTPRYKSHWAEKMFYSMHKRGEIDLVNMGVLYEEWEDVLDRDPYAHWKAMRRRDLEGDLIGPW